MSELRAEMGEVTLGPVPLKVGLEVGYGGPDPKWMEIIGPTEPTVSAPACKGEREWGAIFQSAGQEIASTFEEKEYSPGNEWYLTVCGVNEIVASLAFAENPSEPGERCGAGGWSVPGWQVPYGSGIDVARAHLKVKKCGRRWKPKHSIRNSIFPGRKTGLIKRFRPANTFIIMNGSKQVIQAYQLSKRRQNLHWKPGHPRKDGLNGNLKVNTARTL